MNVILHPGKLICRSISRLTCRWGAGNRICEGHQIRVEDVYEYQQTDRPPCQSRVEVEVGSFFVDPTAKDEKKMRAEFEVFRKKYPEAINHTGFEINDAS